MSELVPRFYAFNAYYYAFYDKSFVTSIILKDISNAEAIYSDPVYGMSNSETLFLWFQAAPFLSSSEQPTLYAKLESYFGLSRTQMNQIYNKGSSLYMIYQYVHYQIRTEYLFTTPDFSDDQL